MNNETTASQPKEPHWIDGEQSALGGKTAREGYAANPEYAGLYPAASQPKSIGDDVKLENLLSEYASAVNRATSLDRETFLREEIIRLFHSSALAAQASATIQAAPVKSIDHDAFWVLVARCKDAAPGADYNAKRNELVAYVDALKLSAAIQEPVMVAEPGLRNSVAARKHAERINNMHKGVVGVLAAIKAEHLAAPMVADPAGVTVEKLPVHYVEGLENGGYYLCTDVIRALAATVKSVPSEALDAGPFTLEQRMPPKDTEVLIYWPCSDGTFGCAVDEWSDLYEDPIGMGGPTICVGEGWMRYEADVTHWAPIPVVNFAAPLTDKTGGGE